MKAYSSLEIQEILDNYTNGIKDNRIKDILYRNQWGVKNGDLAMSYTNDEILEFARCKHDPIYFFENYCKIFTSSGFQNIKLREYQKDLIKSYYENRFNISAVSRQIGITTIISLLALHEATFEIDQTILVVGPKLNTVEMKINMIQKMYENLPFFLKPGVNTYDKSRIRFNTGSMIIGKSKSYLGFGVNKLFIDDFAFLTANDVNSLLSQVVPATMCNTKTKIFISSSPNGINRFYEIWNNAGRKEGDPSKNRFIAHSIYWWQVPGRDENWKEKEIANLGIEYFNQSYDVQFFAHIPKIKVDPVEIKPMIIKLAREHNSPDLISLGSSRIDGLPVYKYTGNDIESFGIPYLRIKPIEDMLS